MQGAQREFVWDLVSSREKGKESVSQDIYVYIYIYIDKENGDEAKNLWFVWLLPAWLTT